VPAGRVITHGNSRENLDLALSMAQTHRDNILDGHQLPRSGSRLGMIAYDDVAAFCADQGCALADWRPINFFLPRMNTWKTFLDKPGIKWHRQAMNHWLDKPDVQDFVTWFEDTLAARMPTGLAPSFVMTLEKPAAAD
jgi:hypothetical protein